MIRPTKHSHPDKTVVSLAVLILARLKAKRVLSFDELLNVAKVRISGAEFIFLPALNLLFLLDLLEYRPMIDSFEYTGK